MGCKFDKPDLESTGWEVHLDVSIFRYRWQPLAQLKNDCEFRSPLFKGETTRKYQAGIKWSYQPKLKLQTIPKVLITLIVLQFLIYLVKKQWYHAL